MTCTLYRAPDETLRTLWQKPEYFDDLRRLGEPPFRYEEEPGFVGRLLRKKGRTVQLGHDQLPFPTLTEEDSHSVDKGWHVLHYLMTGVAGETPGPLGFFLGGGMPIGTQHPNADVVPRALLAAEARVLADAVAVLSEDVLRARFDWPEMMRQQIYPEIVFDGPVPTEFREGYLGQFGHLRQFLQATAALNRGVIVSYG